MLLEEQIIWEIPFIDAFRGENVNTTILKSQTFLLLTTWKIK